LILLQIIEFLLDHAKRATYGKLINHPRSAFTQEYRSFWDMNVASIYTLFGIADENEQDFILSNRQNLRKCSMEKFSLTIGPA